MRRWAMLGLAAALAGASGAEAAAPDAGTRDGELACVGLMSLGLAGASASDPSYPKVVAAMAMALGYHLGRLSKSAPTPSKAQVDAAMARLSLEEKNTYGNQCLKQAASGMQPVLGAAPAPAGR